MKWNIALGVAGIVATIAGTVYTQWPSTDPRISWAGVTVSADMITLGLVMLGASLLSILLILASRPLWPVVRQRLKSRRQRFMELAPELRELSRMTHSTSQIVGEPTQAIMPSAEHRTRTFLMVEKLKGLGVDCSTSVQSNSTLRTWRTLSSCFEVLAVLADARKLDEAKEAGKAFQDVIREGSGN